ncbi:MAG: alpha/beta fold hydrolase [Arenimonas sp.]|jgi:pimeloyl-ACP methyl ester carboxylesterase
MARKHVALAVSLGLALTTLGVAGAMPGRVLDAEFARQRWLAGASVHTVRVGDHRWTYLEAGQGPLIVLLHGFTGAKENWLPLMRELARTHRVIAPDLPGWGESERRADESYGPSEQVERIAQFLRHFNERPALVVGHSMGGQFLGLLGARHPDRVGPIALMSSAGVRFEENSFGREVMAGRNPFEVRTRAELHRYLGIVFEDPPFVPWPADEAMVRKRRLDVQFEQKVLDSIGRGPEAFTLESEMGRIRAPVLLLWCRDDRVIDVSAAEIFHRGLAQSQTVLLAGCGHMPMMAQPGNVAAALREFIDTHSAEVTPVGSSAQRLAVRG